ncbi:MAG: hypothetical protein OHK0052_18400 [Anaerolineales bacterium]
MCAATLVNALHLGTLGLQTLVDNLLEGASIESGQFRVLPHACSLPEIIAEVTATLQPLCEKYEQPVSLHLPPNLPAVQADPRRTAQSLVNYLSNAIKWNPARGNISIHVVQQENALHLTVADEGPGLPPDQPDLFRRFVYKHSGSGRAEYGAGLGLSVVKAIIEAQGGQVGAHNRPEGGAAFWFMLPLAEPEILP